jgi:hypothetical protein
VCLTISAVNLRLLVPRLVRRLIGKLFGTGATSPRRSPSNSSPSRGQGILLITKARTNTHERLLAYAGKLLGKRALIESVNDYLKNDCHTEHSRYRSSYAFLAHHLAGLIASCHQPKKPSLLLDRDRELLAAG